MTTYDLMDANGRRVGEITRPDGYDLPSVVVYGTVAFVLGTAGKYWSAPGAAQAVTPPWPRSNEDGL